MRMSICNEREGLDKQGVDMTTLQWQNCLLGYNFSLEEEVNGEFWTKKFPLE